MDPNHIDTLLERYLTLLDEYDRLRSRLSRCQSDVFHNIARANFSAERSMRYGRDHYDDRMQASRKLDIENDAGHGSLRFEVVNTRKVQVEEDEPTDKDEPGTTNVKEEEETKDTEAGKEKKPVDPLRWFGLFAPQPLRSAQTQSVEVVETIIPRLVTVDAEMHNIEIEVRRARKKRAKSEEKVKKAEMHSTGTAVEAS